MSSSNGLETASSCLRGKVAVVTGAGQGIGEAIARSFHAAGAQVVLGDISGLQDAVAADLGHGAASARVDVSDDAAVAALIERAVATFGGLDVLCNNAGIDGSFAATADYSPDEFDRILAVNLRGVFLGQRHAIPQMLKRGGGSIINVASIAGMVAFPMMPAYCASKAAVLGLTRCTAAEYARSGIRCNAICPGGIRTPMFDEVANTRPELLEATESMTPLGHMGVAGDIASTATFLAVEGSRFVTGIAIPVDGGYTTV